MSDSKPADDNDLLIYEFKLAHFFDVVTILIIEYAKILIYILIHKIPQFETF